MGAPEGGSQDRTWSKWGISERENDAKEWRHRSLLVSLLAKDSSGNLVRLPS